MKLSVAFLDITEPDVARCRQRPVDLVFLLDGSERLGPSNFQHVREFLQKVANTLRLAQGKKYRTGARLALIEFSKERNHLAFQLTHDSAVIADGIAHLPYLDSSSSLAPAINETINNILGKGNARKTRPHSEVSFVFITDGMTDSSNLEEAVRDMRVAQVVSTVIAAGSDVDQDVLLKLVMNDQDAIFGAKDFSDLSQSTWFNSFIQWVC